jgi:hypothetical protein
MMDSILGHAEGQGLRLRVPIDEPAVPEEWKGLAERGEGRS